MDDNDIDKVTMDDIDELLRNCETPIESAARRMAEAQSYLQAWDSVPAPTNPEDWAKSFTARAREQEKYLRAEVDLKNAVRLEASIREEVQAVVKLRRES